MTTESMNSEFIVYLDMKTNPRHVRGIALSAEYAAPLQISIISRHARRDFSYLVQETALVAFDNR